MPAKKKAKNNDKVCFVIAPIGDEGSETRRRSDLVFRHVISPAVKECGYKPVRADKISEPGIITTQIIQHIAEDPMVVADLSERNANVFYELALRHALKKPVIQLIGKGEKIPFDIAATRIIVLEHTDLDSVDETKKEMVKQIKAAEAPSFEPETPITVAIELQSLQSSEEPQDKRFGDLLASLQEVQKSVLKCERKLSKPEELIPPDYFARYFRRFTREFIPPIEYKELMYLLEMLAEKVVAFSKKPIAAERKKILELIKRLRDMLYRILRESERY